jgi:hypothetical protein
LMLTGGLDGRAHDVGSTHESSRPCSGGLHQLTRGLRLLTREIVKEANGTARGRRHKPSPGRRLHGQYIGLIRTLPLRKKAMVRAVHAKKGVEAAIRMAREMRHSG